MLVVSKLIYLNPKMCYDAGYIVSSKLVEDADRYSIFIVQVGYLPILRRCYWSTPKVKRTKVLYSKEAIQKASVSGRGTKFFLPTPIGYCSLVKSTNQVKFTLSCFARRPWIELNVGERCPVYELHSLKGNGLVDFKIKLTKLFYENEGVFKADWKLKDGLYDGIQIWDFHLGWDYYSGAYHYKFTPNKNFV